MTLSYIPIYVSRYLFSPLIVERNVDGQGETAENEEKEREEQGMQSTI